MTRIHGFDPKRDLVLEREIEVPRELVWEVWTKPEHLPHWFVPAPWSLAECEIDLRPGGRFRTVMRSPEGELHPGDGCFLEVVPLERLVFTDALAPGFRPAENPFFTAILTLEALGARRTRYVATAMHRDEAGRARHEDMGFHTGWGAALDQLVAYTKKL
jgi:uncharacterized protein YndB with AHSA1/START domain